MGLIADLLDDVQDRGAAVKDNGVVLLAVDVDDLFPLGDGGERLGGEAELVERVRGGMELAEAAVDQDERGQGLASLFGLRASASGAALTPKRR